MNFQFLVYLDSGMECFEVHPPQEYVHMSEQGDTE